MANPETAIPAILNDVLDEYGPRVRFSGASRILVSDPNIAKAVHKATEYHRTTWGPKITYATRGAPQSADESSVEGIGDVKAFDNLEMDTYTHAIFGIASEDPKYILQGLKTMIFAMQPKGIAIVISLKQEAGQAEGEDKFTVSFEDKMKYQSKGRVQHLSDVLEYAGFEKGKIRSSEKSMEVDGKKVEAEIVLAMKWDQLTG